MGQDWIGLERNDAAGMGGYESGSVLSVRSSATHRMEAKQIWDDKQIKSGWGLTTYTVKII